jgi:spore coat protein U-like protein
MRTTILSAIALLALTGVASANTATSNMSVTATVTSDCTISAGALAFGNYGLAQVNGADLDSTATLTVQCTDGATPTITLGQGQNANTGSTDAAPLRRLKNGSNYLNYALFSDTNRSVTWGNTAGTGAGYTGTGASTSVTVFGRVPASQNVLVGSYSDTVVATITF